MGRVRFTPKTIIIGIISAGLLFVFIQNSKNNFLDKEFETRVPLHVPKLVSDASSDGINGNAGVGVPFITNAESSDNSQPKITVLNSDPRKPSIESKLSTKNSIGGSCNIPKLSVSSPEIEASYKKPTPLKCNKYRPNWLYLDDAKVLQYTDYAKNFLDASTIKCVAKYFTRATDSTVVWIDIPELIIGTTKLNQGDFISIDCTAANDNKWKHIFMSLSPQQSVIDRARNASHSSAWSGLSVYWFSFDSMSQQAFRRLLPKTVAFLEKTMGSIVLNGYNIVGDGTPQAFIPILTGQTELELPLTRKRYPDAKFVDVYPFIWKNFSKAGYATMYGEDAAAIGTFTYRLKGFKDQPTDHYPRTYFLRSEQFFPSRHCFGNENQFDVWAKYAADFMKLYPKDVPKFSVLHHSDLTHDNAALVSIADDSIMAHFKELFENGFFDNAVVFVGADHGHRFAEIRETQQGQLEERLPFMSISLPSTYRSTPKGQQILSNLMANVDRLSSPFDIHATLADILELPSDLTTPQDASKSRSLSLFRPIPSNRTCQQADIEPHWCTCLSWQPSTSTESTLLARAVVQTINAYTSESRDLCSLLRLDTVIDAKRLIPDEKVLKYGGVKDADGFVPDFKGTATATAATYMLTFTTLPGNARYEATVLYDSKKNDITIDMLTISHVNKYGDAPHCIIDKNYFLAAYCVCYDKITAN